MKIYNKKDFISGMVSLSTCVMGIIAIISKGLSVKMGIWTVILFLISLTEIRRSFSETMSKEDITKSEEEIVKYLKTYCKSLKILNNINYIIIIGSMISYAITKSEFLLGVFILASIYAVLDLSIELIVNIYYEKNK